MYAEINENSSWGQIMDATPGRRFLKRVGLFLGVEAALVGICALGFKNDSGALALGGGLSAVAWPIYNFSVASRQAFEDLGAICCEAGKEISDNSKALWKALHGPEMNRGLKSLFIVKPS